LLYFDFKETVGVFYTKNILLLFIIFINYCYLVLLSVPYWYSYSYWYS